MSNITKAIDTVIQNSLAVSLNSDGYIKKSRTFLLILANHIKVVNIQASNWNRGSEGSFTMNLGVYFPVVAELIDVFQIKAYPKEYDCTIRTRIGMLMPDMCDKWWRITSNTIIESVETDLLNAWLYFGKPWLIEVSTYDGAKQGLIMSKRFLQAAGIALVQGRREEASELLKIGIKENPRGIDKLREWGKKNNLLSENE
jgi:hypothetical protein